MTFRFLLVAVALLAGTYPQLAAAASGNVVLFVSDDHGRDAGCYGNPVIQTPNLDRLAAEGTRFEYAYCTTASCSASRSVILTGMYNHATGQYGHQHAYHHFVSFPHIKSLPVYLSAAGYRTVHAGKYHVAPEEVYRFDQSIAANARSAVELAEKCREAIAAEDDRPLFLYICTADPHRSGDYDESSPHRPNRFGNRDQGYPGVKEVTYDPDQVIVPPFLPDTPVCRAELAQYYQSVSRMDQGLGRLMDILKESGKWDETLLIYVSDNGIAFAGAKTTAYEPGLRLPCIVRCPGRSRPGSVCNAMITWADLVPTILEFAGVAPLPRAIHGRSFLGVIGQEDPDGWDEIYASHTFHEITMYYPMRVVRSGNWKLIWNIAHGLPYPFASDLWESPTFQDRYRLGPDTLYGARSIRAYINRPAFELYDLEHDPHEVRNLAEDPDHAGVLNALKEKLKQFQRRTGDPWILKWDYE